MKTKNAVVLLFLTFISLKNFATHIVGGEIYYDCLGNNNYAITLKIYRDCYNGTAPYDSPALLYIFNSSGTLLDSVPIAFPGSTILPASISNPCLVPPTNICVEEAIYQTTINLPALAGGYDLTYQRCCRNGTILNLANPNNEGATYLAHIPDPGIAVCNSSPRFNHFPPIFVCVGIPLTFDHSATDLDGDSLYYQFCDPYSGLDPNCPQLGSGCATAPSPPIGFVQWFPPYSSSYPMSSSPAMSLNPHTGLLTGTPNMMGQWVVGVCASEYRNGVLVSVNKRDFQFNVVNCPNIPVASIPAQTTFCTGFTVNFNQSSINAFTYHWDFGDLSTLADTSNLWNTTYTFPTAGTYTVTLTINPGQLCVDTAQNVFVIEPLLDPTYVPPAGQCIDGNSFNFTAGGAFTTGATFLWSFPNASPSTSTLQNPTNIVFNTTGMIPVTLTISEYGCTKSYVDSILIYPRPNASFTTSTTVSCILNPVQFVNNSTGDAPMTYFWDFANGSTSTLQNPTTIYSSIGTYNVSLVVTSMHGCVDTVTLPNQLAVQNPPIAAFTATPICTNHQVNFAQSSAGAVYYAWDFGEASTLADTSSANSPSWQYATPGTYTATLIINPGSTCTDTVSHSFIIYPDIVPQITPPAGQCIEGNSFGFAAGGTFSSTSTFHWNFGNHAAPNTSNQQNPTGIVFDSVGIYPIVLSISDHGCTVSDTNQIVVFPKPFADFGLASTVGCVMYGVQFLDSSFADTPLTYAWDFGNGQTSTLQNPVAVYITEGSYNITLIVTTQHGCKDTVVSSSPFTINPTPTAGFHVSPHDTAIYFPNITMNDASLNAVGWQVYWGDGSMSTTSDTVHHYSNPGIYSIMQVVVNQYGCYDTAYSSVEILPQYLFWIPNAFSPADENGINDIFKPVVIGVHNYNFYIFDRWGETVFHTSNYEEGWNGFYKGKLCSNDVFVYKISFTDDSENIDHKYIGKVTLVK